MAWFNTNWTFRKKVTADNTLVAATETDFPALLVITDADLAADAQNNGNDILFTSDDKVTKIPHEIESFDGGTGELVVWIKIPSLSASVDTDIYMYYGNEVIGNQEDPTNVWDSNYQGVWHLAEDPGPGGAGDIKDSTSNGNDLTADPLMTSADLVDGQIDGAIEFDGVDGFLSGGDAVDVAGTAFSMQLWFEQIVNPGGNRFLVIKGQEDGSAPQNYQLVTNTNAALAFDFFNGGFNTHTTANDTIVVGASQRIDITYDGSNVIIYVDGLVVLNEAETTAMLADAEDFTIGGSDSGVSNRTVEGIVDEVRISNTPRDADLITTEFNNQQETGVASRLSTAASVGSASTLAHTVPGGSSRMLVACFTHEFNGQTAVTSVDYGGQAMVQAVQIDTPDSGFSAGASIWYLLEAEIAAASDNIITPTYSTDPGSRQTIHAAAFAGINQTGGATTNPNTNSAETNESTPNPLGANLTETIKGIVIAINASGNSSSTIWGGGPLGMTEQTDQTGTSTHGSMADRLSSTNGTAEVQPTIASQNRAVTASATFAPVAATPFFIVGAEEKVRNRAQVIAS